MIRNNYTDPLVFIAIIVISLVTYGVMALNDHHVKTKNESVTGSTSVIEQSADQEKTPKPIDSVKTSVAPVIP